MDEQHGRALEQLPADGSPIPFEEWRQRVATQVGPEAVPFIAQRYSRAYVSYELVNVDGALALMVGRKVTEVH